MKPALVLIDLQQDYLAQTNLRPAAWQLVRRASLLRDGCARAGVPVFHGFTTIPTAPERRMTHWRLEDRRWCVERTPGHAPPAALEPRAGERIVHKCGFSVFEDLSLHTQLRQAGCDTVILAGLHLHACLRSAATDAYRHGYRVVIAEDAVATNDPMHAAVTRRYLADRAVGFQPVDAILRRLTAVSPPTRADHWPAQAVIHRSPGDQRQVLFEVHDAPTEVIDRAVRAARDAFGPWRDSPMARRRSVLLNVAALIERDSDQLTRALVEHVGKPVRFAKQEVELAVAFLRSTASQPDPMVAPDGASGTGYRLAPLGVVAVITPWNNPLAVPVGKLAPALLFGNTVVWKPAPAGSAIARHVARLFIAAGCTEEVRIVEGGAATARQLASAAHIDAITLTGSIDAGFAIHEAAARRHLPYQAELGGNNGVIVCPDADLDRAASEVAHAAFGFAGQRCTAVRRVILEDSCHDRFMSRLLHAVRTLVWGDPREPATTIGPVISAAKRDELEALIEMSRESGFTVHRSHAVHHAPPHGAYLPPTMVQCDDPRHPVVQEESFGPVLVIQRARGFDHALELLGGVNQGLVASIFTESARNLERFLSEARSGILKVNQAAAGADPDLPFGGWKASGVGPAEHGRFDREFYTRAQAIYELPAHAPFRIPT